MGSLDAVQELLASGASVDVADLEGKTPLHHAAMGGHDYAALLLIQSGAKVNALDERRETAAHYAAYFGHLEALKVLVSNQAEVNIQDFEGITPLHWAALQGFPNVVYFLLESGAYPNFMEANGNRYTPLDYAVVGNHSECAELLSQGGATSIEEIQKVSSWGQRREGKKE